VSVTPCPPVYLQYAVDSDVRSMFFSRETPSASVPCRVQLLPNRVTYRVSASRMAFKVGSACTGFVARRVEPKATTLACLSGTVFHAEEVDVLRIGPGPPAFDEVGTQFVQLLGDHDLVLGRERDVLGLRTVAQGGVVDFDWARVVRFHLTLSPVQRPRAGPGSLSLSSSPRSRRRS